MNILFYISPLMVAGNPYFYEGAIKNKLLPICHAAIFAGHNTSFILPEVFSNMDFPLQTNINWVNTTLLSEKIGIYGDLDKYLYENNEKVLKKVTEFYSQKIKDQKVDIIFAWECCTDHLRFIFPEAKIVHLMPGFLSRLPYPDLLYFDTEGLFKKSCIYNNIEKNIENHEFDECEINKKIEEINKFFNSIFPIEKKIQELIEDRHYSNIVLLPLQYSKHYNFQVDVNYNNQLEFLQDYLKMADKAQITIVTQYIANEIYEDNLSEYYTEYLQKNYPNLVFDQKFNEIDNISQYILPFVDEVTTCSSSLGLQALIFNKKVNVIGDTFLRNIISFASKNELNRKKAISYLFSKTIPFKKLSDGNTFNEALNTILGQSSSIQSIEEDFRYERALQKLGNSFSSLSSAYQIPPQLKNEIENCDLISFDIFDTLIERPFAQPTDIFIVIEKKINDLNILENFDFSNSRILAEKIAKEVYKDLEEINLDQIYEVLRIQYNLTSEIISKIKDLEINTEKELMTFRPIGKELYKLCTSLGKKIVYTSDMYLPRNVILSFLKDNDYSIEHDLFLSSEIGFKKSTGTLFEYISKKTEVEYSKIVHIGDNNNGDFNVPRKIGIKATRLTRAVDKMYNHEFFRNNFKIRGVFQRSLQESAIIYMIARQIFDNPFIAFDKYSICQNNTKNLGYIILGTCLTDYSIWLRKQVKKNKNDGLYFIARDGKVIKKVYDSLFFNDDIETKYIYGSRKLMRYTSLPSLSDVYSCIKDLTGKIPRLELQENFGWTYFDENLNNKVENYTDLVKAYQSITQCFDYNLVNHKYQNNLLLDYLTSNKFFSFKKPAIVEIGYAGTIQNFLQRNLDKKPLTGYYYALFDTSYNRRNNKNIMYGYVSNGENRLNILHSIAHNGFMYETLFCSEEDTIIKLAKMNGEVYAIRNINEKDNVRKNLIRDLHYGAVEYAKDYYEFYKNCFEYLTEDRELGARMITQFIKKPNSKDVKFFEGVIFESNFSNTSFKYVIPPRDMLNIYKKDPSLAVWKEGTTLFFNNLVLNEKKQGSKTLTPTVSQSQRSKQGTSSDPNKVPFMGKKLIISNALESIEKKIIAQILKNDYRKLRKYENNPDGFFEDSKIKLLKSYNKLKKKI